MNNEPQGDDNRDCASVRPQLCMCVQSFADEGLMRACLSSGNKSGSVSSLADEWVDTKWRPKISRHSMSPIGTTLGLMVGRLHCWRSRAQKFTASGIFIHILSPLASMILSPGFIWLVKSNDPLLVCVE